MLDALGGHRSHTAQTHLQEPDPLSDPSPAVRAPTTVAGKITNCDLRTTERYRTNRKQEAVCLSAASLRPRLFVRVCEGTRRVVRLPLHATHGVVALVHPCTAERMLLLTFRGRKVRRVRAAARIKIKSSRSDTTLKAVTQRQIKSLLQSILGRPGMRCQPLSMRECRRNPPEGVGTVLRDHDQARAFLEIIDTER